MLLKVDSINRSSTRVPDAVPHHYYDTADHHTPRKSRTSFSIFKARDIFRAFVVAASLKTSWGTCVMC